MSEQLYEQISAFVDGELPEHETELLLKRLEREPELRAALVRYSTIGAGLRDRALGGSGVSRGFAQRVIAAVAVDNPGPALRVPARLRLRSSWLRPVAGLAVAAAVAAVAILGVQQLQDPASAGPAQIAATPASPPIVIGDLSLAAPSYTVPAPTTDSPIVPAARLTNYVVAHSQYSSALGRRNVLSGIVSEDPMPLDESGEPDLMPAATEP
jgi:sigma-E factor negative regulatory protein RseA